jgi:hypothetical protein
VITFCVKANSTGNTNTVTICSDVYTEASREILDISYLDVEANEFEAYRLNHEQTADNYTSKYEGISALDAFTVKGNFANSLGRSFTTYSFYRFTTSIYLKEEEEKADSEKSFFIFFETSSDNGLSFEHSFVPIPFKED